ncbi:hypothetical protein [Nocardia sp. XZ_19_369]|uniref:hypothetical protein n=1 Tax=Nocardia sp. XZ_19_369 TaxID=2769487 RepID=UPI00188EACA7|nr:hypothetical protein [Nocardia sp. XZ_19_369]
MNEIEPLQQVEVLTDPARVWIIAREEYADREPIAVVQGTKDDAERYTDHYNATHPWHTPSDKAHVWTDTELITPTTQ